MVTVAEHLTDEDREALVDALRRAPNAAYLRLPGPVDISPTFGPYLDTTVEAIVARHVEAERERIAQAIEAEAAHRPGAINYTPDYRDGLRGAARIARGGARFDLPLHRTEAGYPRCSTCDGGGCLDCTDPA